MASEPFTSTTQSNLMNNTDHDNDNLSLDSATLPSRNKNRHVRFGTLDIHEYAIVLGDTKSRIPDAGAPMSIDMEAQAHYNFEVEEYEREMLSKRRTKDEFWYSPKKRTDLLLELGYSLKQIERTTKAVEKVRLDRIESNKVKGWKRILPFANKKHSRFGNLVA